MNTVVHNEDVDKQIKSLFFVSKAKSPAETYAMLASTLKEAPVGAIVETDEVPYINLGCMVASLLNGLLENGVPADAVEIRRPTRDTNGYMLANRDRPFMLKKLKDF